MCLYLTIKTINESETMKNILGRKVGMTSVFTEDGRSVPVTVIAAGPCTVVQRKTKEHRRL